MPSPRNCRTELVRGRSPAVLMSGEHSDRGHQCQTAEYQEMTKPSKNKNANVQVTRNYEGTGLKRPCQQQRKEHHHERITIRDQRPHLWNDRGRSHRSPCRTRGKDILLLQRPLSAEVSVHTRRCEARGSVWRLLYINTRRMRPGFPRRPAGWRSASFARRKEPMMAKTVCRVPGPWLNKGEVNQ